MSFELVKRSRIMTIIIIMIIIINKKMMINHFILCWRKKSVNLNHKNNAIVYYQFMINIHIIQS